MSPCILAHAGNANTAVNAMTVNHRSSFDTGFGSPFVSDNSVCPSIHRANLSRFHNVTKECL